MSDLLFLCFFFAVEEFFSCLLRPDLTFLPIKEAVDVGLAQADEG